MEHSNDTEALRAALEDIARLAGLWSETCEAANDLGSAEVMERLGRVAPQVMAAIAARAAFALEQQESEAEDFEVRLVELLAFLGDELSRYQDLIASEAHLDTERDRPSLRDESS